MIQVTGGQELRDLSLRLKAAGEIGLRKNMNVAIRAATQPAKDAVKASALATLPKSGGANEFIANKKIISSVLTGPRTAGVRLRMKGQSPVDAGNLRHPTFGNRSNWQTTRVQPGFWTMPLLAMRPKVAAGCLLAMRETSIEAGFKFF